MRTPVRLSEAVRSPFGRAVLALASSSLIAQAIVYAASPVLTRLYTPADFGILTAYLALLATISFLGTFNFELAIPIAPDEATALALTWLALTFLGVSGVIGVLIVLLLPYLGFAGGRPWSNDAFRSLWLGHAERLSGVRSVGLSEK